MYSCTVGVCVYACVCTYRQISVSSVFQKTNEIINSPLGVEVWFQSGAKYCGSADHTQD